MKNESRRIAKEIGIPGYDDPEANPLKILKEWFEGDNSGLWLLVYDNVDDIDLMYDTKCGRLSDYFPVSERGSILITSRNWQVGINFRAGPAVENVIRVTALDYTESLALMAAILGEDDLPETSKRRNLADELGGIPLAIVQAASFIQENESTVGRYLEMYEASDEEKVQLLSEKFEDGTRDAELKNLIATSWMVTYEYMKEHRPLAADTLCMMSMFNTQAIPEAFISKTAQGAPARASNMEKALGTLKAYSLISDSNAHDDSRSKGSGRSFDLHRLVRLSTRNWLTLGSTYDHWLAEAIDTLSMKYDKLERVDFATNWKAKSAYLPHALALISSPQLSLQDEVISIPTAFRGQTIVSGHTTKGEICPSCTANILTEMLSSDKSLLQRLNVARKAIRISSHTFGLAHLQTLHHRSVEAQALWHLEESAEAERTFRDILQGYTLELGPGHRHTVRTKRFLAETLNDQGKYEEAEQHLLRLLEICKQEYGDQHVFTIEAMQTMSTSLVLQGLINEAVDLNSKISRLPHNVNSKYKLAKSHVSLSEYTAAEKICLNLLEDGNALDRDEYVSVDKIWHLLGKIYRKQKAYEKAEDILLQALPYRQKKYGEYSRVRDPQAALSPCAPFN